MSIYNSSGALRVSVSDGIGFKGYMSFAGSIWVTEAPGGTFVGNYAPDGSLYVTVAPSSGFVGRTAPDGSTYVSLHSPVTNGSTPVEVVAGSIGINSIMSLASVVRAGTATYFDSAGVLQDAAANTARIDYNPFTLARHGLLVEAAATVDGKSGEDIRTNAEGNALSVWTSTTTTGTTGFAAPDGSTNAMKLAASGGLAAHSRSTSASTAGAGGQTHSVSVFAKAAELNTTTFGFASGGGVSWATFTLTGAGSVGSVANVTNWSAGVGSITRMADDWYKLTFSAVNSGTGVVARLYPGTNAAYDNDGAGVLVWGFNQALNAATIGSYVRNAGASVTRANDNVSLLTSALPQWNPLAGTVVVDFGFGPSVASRSLFDMSDGTANNRIRVFTTSVGTLGLGVTVGGVAHTQIYSSGNLTPLTRNKVAVSFAEDRFYISVNGAAVGSSLTGALPVVDRIQFGANLSLTASTFLNGHLTEVGYASIAYPSQTLIELSAP